VVDGGVMSDAEKPSALGRWRFQAAAFRKMDEGFLEHVFDVVFVGKHAA
jgi:hypothetical protein